jgi:sugar phosphate isomerase/epimerase
MADFVYCLNTSTIRPTPLMEKIKIAGKLGYQAIEPWNDEFNEYIKQGGKLADVKSAIADAGLKAVSVIALHNWITTQGEAYTKALEDCKKRMEQAAFLGSPFIVASPPREKVDMAKASERFSELLKLGRQIGVRPSMEFLGFVDGVKTLAAAWQIASGTGDSEATVVADVFHLVRGGGQVDDLLTITGEHLANFHMNDSPASPPTLQQTDADRVLPGEGVVDLKRVIANLRKIGYHGPLSLELFNRTLWKQDPTDVCKRGLERMKALVEG